MKNILDLMKETPLIALKGRGPANGRRARLWGKLELAQPGQMKDRIARRLIEDAVRDGKLPVGGVIIESSSGTMAEGLARVGAFLGFRVIIVADPSIDRFMQAKLRAFGTEILMVDAPHPIGGYQQSRLERVREIRREHPGAFWPRQYDNSAIPAAYEEEIVDEITSAIGTVDVFVAAVGSGSSLCGPAAALLRRNSNVRIIAVDATGSVQFNQPNQSRRQTGHGSSVIAGNINYKNIHEVHWLNDGECFNACRELARTEAIFAGGSSGAAWVVASWAARHLPDGNVVMLFPDRGDRYIEKIYDDEYMEREGLTGVFAADEPVTIRYGVDVATRWSRAALPHDGSASYYASDAVLTASISAETDPACFHA